MYKKNRVAQLLGTKYPLIQAPMAWITNARMVSEVCNAGGLGVLGPHAGKSSIHPVADEPPYSFREELQKTKKLTDKPFGVNIFVSKENGKPIDSRASARIELILEEGVKHFITVGEANQALFQFIKERGGIIIHRPLNPTLQEMRQAESWGADLLVATGYDEGGYIPTSSWGTFTVVPAVVDAVNIPVLAAGGINDRRGVKAAFALGAEGVFIGTRFIATQECPAAEVVKQKIITSGYQDLLFVSPNKRSIATQKAIYLAELHAQGEDTEEQIERIKGLGLGMLEGQMNEGIVSVNSGIDTIKNIPTIAQLVHELMDTE
ncbi:MAG: NAD(P)H-dependent flavin oxidoreductase [Phocaeicola sp.]